MTVILPDLSSPALVAAIQQNLYDLTWSLRDHWKQACFEQNAKQRRWVTPIPFAFIFNAVISTQPPDGDEIRLIQDTVAFFQSRDRKEFDWWLEPGLEASDWGRQLEAYGLSFQNAPPGMAVELGSLPETVPFPADVQIRPVEDAAAIKTWTRTFIEGYGLPPDWEGPCGDMMLASMQASMVSYQAAVDGQPVATAGVFYAAGVACIINVATLNAWRGKGIGAAVTLKALLDARSAGYRVGVLQASDLGYPVYQRLGFKEVCRMDHYHWQDGEKATHLE
jgi:GNAT superfamily N-acetyltransferase